MKEAREVYYTQNDVDIHSTSWVPNNKFTDITGRIFGKLTVLKLYGKEKNHTWWFCKCGCGRIIKASTNRLNSKNKVSCTTCSKIIFSEKCKVGKDKLLNDVLTKFPKLICVDSKDGTARASWDWFCPDCNTPFSSRVGNLMIPERSTPCRCDNGMRFTQWTTELREEQILKRCKLINATFLGWFDDDKYTRSTSRIWLSCNEHPEHKPWDSAVNNFIGETIYGCPECGVLKRAESSKHTLEELIEDGTRVHRGLYTYENYVYKGSRVAGEITCTCCGKPFYQGYDNHINKKKGCRCQADFGYHIDRSGWFYIQSLDHSGCKLGITNLSPEERMYQQSNKSIFKHRLLHKFFFTDGNIPLKIENLCKDKLALGVVPKDDMNDGFTETCFIEDLETILTIVEEVVNDNTPY